MAGREDRRRRNQSGRGMVGGARAAKGKLERALDPKKKKTSIRDVPVGSAEAKKYMGKEARAKRLKEIKKKYGGQLVYGPGGRARRKK